MTMTKTLSQETLSGTLTLTHCVDGFWLYDATRGMNLAIRAKTRDGAFLEALSYYQRRLSEVENAHKELRAQVDAFVGQFQESDE